MNIPGLYISWCRVWSEDTDADDDRRQATGDRRHTELPIQIFSRFLDKLIIKNGIKKELIINNTRPVQRSFNTFFLPIIIPIYIRLNAV